MKILFLILFALCSIIATAQDNKNDTTLTEISTKALWLHADMLTSFNSNFEDYNIGLGFRYEYVGFGITTAYTTYDSYSGKNNYEWYMLNAYGFLPIGKKFAFYGMFGLKLVADEFADAGVGFHFFLGKRGMAGLGVHRNLDVQFFLGLQI